jgi:hypothetical protein
MKSKLSNRVAAITVCAMLAIPHLLSGQTIRGNSTPAFADLEGASVHSSFTLAENLTQVNLCIEWWSTLTKMRFVFQGCKGNCN